jgi:hypothetical protein
MGWEAEEHRIMTVIRTGAGLTRRDIRRLERGRYTIQAIETRQAAGSTVTEIIWQRDDGPDAITEADLPF